MIKKYIRGHSTRGDEVIKELEKLGGVKPFDALNCSYPDNLYIINHKNNNEITVVSSEYLKELIEETFEEIKLPEFKPEEFVIVTEKATNGCDGCIFKKGMHCAAGMWFANDCTEKGIIYRLKQ